MLKQSYDSQDAIPENLRGAYVLSDGKWVLDSLPVDHPVVTKRDELLRENSTQKGTITRLNNEKTALEGSVLPAGHVAVPTGDAQYAEKLKPLGTAAEIESKLQAHDELKGKLESREKSDALRTIALESGYDPDKIAALEDRFPVPSFKEVEVDGKKQQRPIFKTSIDGKEVERTFTEHLESDPKLKPLQESLKATAATNNGTRVHGSSGSSGSPPKTTATRIREQVKREEQQQAADVHPMFNKIPGRVPAATGE